MSKTKVNLAELRRLAEIARSNNTLDVFAEVALQWATEADKEVTRLRGRVRALHHTLATVRRTVQLYYPGMLKGVDTQLEQDQELLKPTGDTGSQV